MTLENTFYALGIFSMIVMLILLIALVVAVFVIRNKVLDIHKQIEDKINEVSHIADRGSDIVAAVGGKVASSAADAVINMLNKDDKKTKRRR